MAAPHDMADLAGLGNEDLLARARPREGLRAELERFGECHRRRRLLVGQHRIDAVGREGVQALEGQDGPGPPQRALVPQGGKQRLD